MRDCASFRQSNAGEQALNRLFKRVTFNHICLAPRERSECLIKSFGRLAEEG